MPTATATAAKSAKSTPERPSDAEVRAARLAALGNALAAAAVGVLIGAWWVLRTTWPRLVPVYWAAAELAAVVIADWLGVRWTAVALAAAIVTAIAGAWTSRSFPVRLYRLAVTAVFGLFAAATVAAGPGALASHPTWTVFGPSLAAALLGWPWWHHLRYRTVDTPDATDGEQLKDLTDEWKARWRDEVVEHGVCAGTQVIKAVSPRPGVTEAVIRLSPGVRKRELMKKGPDVEVALDLADGAVGWRSTGRAAKVRVVIVEVSYIHDGVPWTGTTYNEGYATPLAGVNPLASPRLSETKWRSIDEGPRRAGAGGSGGHRDRRRDESSAVSARLDLRPCLSRTDSRRPCLAAPVVHDRDISGSARGPGRAGCAEPHAHRDRRHDRHDEGESWSAADFRP
jgi:hypothetical protein